MRLTNSGNPGRKSPLARCSVRSFLQTGSGSATAPCQRCASLDDLNATLLSFAGYNGGPNRIARLRQEVADLGLDPNLWFDNVELVVSKQIGRETVQYVSNIYKYYVAYRLIADRIQLREAA